MLIINTDIKIPQGILIKQATMVDNRKNINVICFGLTHHSEKTSSEIVLGLIDKHFSLT